MDAGPGLLGQAVAVKHCLNDALIFPFAIRAPQRCSRHLGAPPQFSGALCSSHKHIFPQTSLTGLWQVGDTLEEWGRGCSCAPQTIVLCREQLPRFISLGPRLSLDSS